MYFGMSPFAPVVLVIVGHPVRMYFNMSPCDPVVLVFVGHPFRMYFNLSSCDAVVLVLACLICCVSYSWTAIMLC